MMTIEYFKALKEEQKRLGRDLTLEERQRLFLGLILDAGTKATTEKQSHDVNT